MDRSKDPFWANIYKQAGCLGKDSWPNRAQAESVAKAVRRRNDAKINPYLCEACQQWHIGSPSTFKKR